ncbi:hypothetical protein [Clostridium algidicarnis]|uniref:hypothetical protein n=1 Tax=Clostridium algidicarnis TaxID=37659 RepID=UPI001C0B6D32|nr:hypothetical protein [Clostridium algidicarnis]MBU3203606.1 hypothetical protein [Clostridium algidicarnis]MBU3211760.1 hypothetical protein [Clostridium algidicarnis]MBU3221733.1 hypothetical protein [Clostridium algidicarnis]
MSVKSMQGTSAHISYLKSNEENRRHKTKYIYFDKGMVLDKCEKIKGKYIYLLLPKDTLHLWVRDEFREKIRS